MKSVSLILLSLATLALLQVVTSAKDPLKRKLLLASKLKADAARNNETRAAAEPVEAIVGSTDDKKVNVTASLSPRSGNETGSTTFSITVSDELLEEEAAEKEAGKIGASAVSKPRPGLTYLSSFRDLFLRFLELLGIGTGTGTLRKNRGMIEDEENNVVDSGYRYKEELRTTVGAVLGRPECIQKAACRVGKYLKSFKAKEVIIVIMEKFTPKKWTDTVRMLKDSAIHNNQCEYKCLDD